MSADANSETPHVLTDSTDNPPSKRPRGWWSFDLPENVDDWGGPETGYDGGSLDAKEYARWSGVGETPDADRILENRVEVVVQGFGERAPKVAIYSEKYSLGVDASNRIATTQFTHASATIPCESWEEAVAVAEKVLSETTPDELAYVLDGSLMSCHTFRGCESVEDFFEKMDGFEPPNHIELRTDTPLKRT